mmetsp:Transcript_23454/g.43536  ORF Transcript_23454/g.43536 Transcript_23454/m.43536 type:complete len:107 (-) Transcript_23454:136-456(-)
MTSSVCTLLRMICRYAISAAVAICVLKIFITVWLWSAHSCCHKGTPLTAGVYSACEILQDSRLLLSFTIGFALCLHIHRRSSHDSNSAATDLECRYLRLPLAAYIL